MYYKLSRPKILPQMRGKQRHLLNNPEMIYSKVNAQKVVTAGSAVGQAPVAAIVLPSGKIHSRVMVAEGGRVGQAPVVAMV